MGLNLARCGAGCRSDRCNRCNTSQLAAEFVEVTRLSGHDLARFLVGRGLRSGRVWHLYYGAAAHAVDIAVDKSLGVAAQHGDQHLIQRDACGLVGCSKAASGIAGLDAHGVARIFTGSRGCCLVFASAGLGGLGGCSVRIAVIAQIAVGCGHRGGCCG